MCYWEVLDKNQEIMKNHYGYAGGSVKIPEGGYEILFDNCGSWLYVPDMSDRVPLADYQETKGNGFYTVGIEISSGLWESQGDGSDCYWAVLDNNQETMNNHYGIAGGSMQVPDNSYEVQLDEC